MSDEPDITKGEFPTSDEKDWLQYWRDLRREGPKVLDDAAKQIMGLGTGIAGLYVSILAALKISDVVGDLDRVDEALLVLPVGLWLVSAGLAMVAFHPQWYGALPDAPDDIRAAAKKILTWKRRWLVAAVAVLAVGLVLGATSVFSLTSTKAEQGSTTPTPQPTVSARSR